jgi:NAD(P)-dependent dehydrogenase (short-subunit alcohol dehydrogenase family)
LRFNGLFQQDWEACDAHREVQHRVDRGRGIGPQRALARVLTTEGIKVALAARTPADLDGLAKEIGAKTFACDASKRTDVEKLFNDLDGLFGAPEIVIYNPSYRTRGPIAELDPDEVEKALMTSAFGGFLVGQQAVKRMLPKKHGCVVFTGASASVKGYAQSAAFAMGKFALRGLAQSMSRELHPKGIHVAHIIIDGGIKSERRQELAGKTASLLNPTSIAATYLHIIHQPHSAWSAEVELRPWVSWSVLASTKSFEPVGAFPGWYGSTRDDNEKIF